MLEVFTLGVREQSQRGRTKIGSVIDQDVEPAKLACDLNRDRVDVFLHGDVADDAVGAGIVPRDLFDSFARPCDKSDARASADEFTNESESESGRPARDCDSQT